MPDEIEAVLRLVAEGRLTPEEAAPIIEALGSRRPGSGDFRRERARAAGDDAGSPLRGRQLRIRVTEHGRQVVNLRIPIGLVDAAIGMVPGLGGEQASRIRRAVDSGITGPIIDVEEPGGDGVLISVE